MSFIFDSLETNKNDIEFDSLYRIDNDLKLDSLEDSSFDDDLLEGYMYTGLKLKKTTVNKKKSKYKFKCDVCGKLLKTKLKIDGYCLCKKHYIQYKADRKFKDANPRTIYDKNDIEIKGKNAYITLYDKFCNPVAKAIIDREDIEKVRYIKWKLSSSGYAMNTPKYKGCSVHMSRVILGVDTFVDHKNHNTLDNRKKNLRVCTNSQNQMNVNYKGIYKRGNKWVAAIKLHGKRANLGTYVFEEEALYARWYAEKLLFKEFRCKDKKKPVLDSEDRRKQIRDYVKKKVQRL